jgi:hypothetical protein
MKKVLIIITILTLSLPVFAVDQCASWGCTSTISTLYTNADGRIYIGTPLDEKLANCSAVSGVYFSINPDSANAKEMYSSVLAAYMSNKKIQLRVKEGNAHCDLAYVRFDTNH